MANDVLIDFQGDGASSDSILSYVHIQTAGYSGSYNDYVVPAAANFPLAGLSSLGAAVTPSRYIVRLNFTPFSNGSLPILLKDVTSGGTSLSPVTGAPSLNQYRWWYSANNNTVSPDVIEFNSGQAGHTIAIDCYAKQSILHSEQVNSEIKGGIIGEIKAFGGIVLPNNHLWCDGTSYLRTAYPDLYSVIGTYYGTADGTHFNVPDLRGMFLRGLDGTAGIDIDKAARTALKTGGNTGNNIGSFQADMLKSHRHNFPIKVIPGSVSGVMYSNNIGTDNTYLTDNAGGNETRPVNVYVNYIIRY